MDSFEEGCEVASRHVTGINTRAGQHKRIRPRFYQMAGFELADSRRPASGIAVFRLCASFPIRIVRSRKLALFRKIEEINSRRLKGGCSQDCLPPQERSAWRDGG